MGDSEIDQVFKIFRVLGTPNENNWPDALRLENFKSTFPKFRGMPMIEHTPTLDEHEVDLLSGLVALDPNRRISALAALQHPYFDDMEVTVKVIFIKANASTMKPYDIHLDVDMLALNRLGLYINTSNRDILTRVPVPVGILIQNCEDKKFAVLTSVENDVVVLEKQKQLKRLGFSLRQTRVEQGSAAPQGEKCSICLLEFEPQSEGVAATVKTSCGHHFHRDCWEKHVEHSIQSGMNQLPGIFSFANSSFSDQRAGSIFVHCPLCRESFRAYEVTV